MIFKKQNWELHKLESYFNLYIFTFLEPYKKLRRRTVVSVTPSTRKWWPTYFSQQTFLFKLKRMQSFFNALKCSPKHFESVKTPIWKMKNNFKWKTIILTINYLVRFDFHMFDLSFVMHPNFISIESKEE